MTRWVRFLCFLFHALADSGDSGVETYGDIGQVAIPVAAVLVSWGQEDIEGLK